MGVVIEAAGWAGSVIILVGYGLFSSGRIGNGRLYQFTNLSGALLVSVNVAAHGALPSTIVNVVWAAIALGALVRLGFRRPTGASSLGMPDVAPPVPTTVAPATSPLQILASALTAPISIVQSGSPLPAR